ncbi:L,D-transpeptidase family protein [Planktotalea sp.]|uniref:L,D-transpeptidase family protein n=1 Tax=Planktotalea sp. TaxID=2029877 RepID=UPI0025DB38A8|nr:L,D-transpeptidase family protein [Planktotalea sp.]
MNRRFLLLSTAALFALSACASKFKRYNGPRVTRVIVYKGQRKMHLMSGSRTLKSYDIGLGFAPYEHKSEEGDGRTPEGEYIIDRRNPNSKFHLSIGINYPNAQDVVKAKAAGVKPGRDIFIHGRPPMFAKGGRDWTAGCIAVTDKEMERIYAMVKNGTPISIYP